MPLYEHVFLARQDISQAQVEALIKEYADVIQAGGGTIGKTEYWGLKNLAYKIKKSRKAHYALMNISASAPAAAEMERQMRINENILRFMTVRVEQLEDGPSAMLQKRERDEKRDAERGSYGDRPPRRRDREEDAGGEDE